MRPTDCLIIGHYALSVNRQVQLAELAFGKDSLYYHDALEKTFVTYRAKQYTSSQLYNLFYEPDSADLSFDHVTFEHSFNTAVANLGTALVRRGLTIDFVNTFNAGRDALADRLANDPPLTVAITTTFYISTFPIAQIVRFIRRHAPQVKIVVGGPFIKNIASSHAHDQAELTRLLRGMGADYYVNSTAGEDTLARIIGCERSGAPITQVANVYHRAGNGYAYTGTAVEPSDASRRMVDWGLFRDHIPRLVNVRTTQSCPFDCAFCGLPVNGGKWRAVPLDEIEAELEALHQTGARPGLFFIDETLNFPPQRFKSLLERMCRREFGFPWEAELRCNTLDRETVKLMADSGCQLVHLGIESGNQRILDNMTKRVQLDDYYRAMDLLHEFGIMTSALILVGFPGETEETFRDTFDFIERTRPTLFRVHRWFYDHDTPVHGQRVRYELEGGGYHWRHSTMDSATAHRLATELSLEVKNAIHTDDYSMAFFLAARGYAHDRVRAFLRCFDLAVKEKCRRSPDERLIGQHIERARTALLESVN